MPPHPHRAARHRVPRVRQLPLRERLDDRPDLPRHEANDLDPLLLEFPQHLVRNRSANQRPDSPLRQLTRSVSRGPVVQHQRRRRPDAALHDVEDEDLLRDIEDRGHAPVPHCECNSHDRGTHGNAGTGPCRIHRPTRGPLVLARLPLSVAVAHARPWQAPVGASRRLPLTSCALASRILPTSRSARGSGARSPARQLLACPGQGRTARWLHTDAPPPRIPCRGPSSPRPARPSRPRAP